ncbi:MAG: UvrD-helicase domain-containing protein, partial [Lachnospiraceae bacterium]|nr:UvrD-helicase domain-containing protein [Lachnospiraceae bacterium]
ASEDEAGEPAWVRQLTENAALTVREALAQEERALSLCNIKDGPYMYASAIASDIEMLNALKDCDSYDEYRKALAGAGFIRLGSASKNGPFVEEALKEKAKDLRDIAKKSITDLAKEDFGISFESQLLRIKACERVVKELVKLTREYTAAFAAAKRDKKIVDFTDLEHMCIAILSSDDGNTAREYREYFDEIYVDEYQDSSLVQEELLKYISRGDNLFMVGDVKQSIYSFRLARPQLFINKLKGYVKRDDDLFEPVGDNTGRRIDLSENYRSRSGVIDTVNELFSQIMCSDIGGIVYDDAAALHPGREYPKVPGSMQKTELILADSVRGMNPRELEAKMIAARIKELMRDQLVFDPTDDDPFRMRPVKYSDMVILLRTASGWDEKFKKTISDEGIPVHIMSRTGYFSAPEVSILIDYLRILDNPLQDIPMAAVLLSVFGSMDNNELAILKARFPSGYLYEALKCIKEAEKNADDEAFNAVKDKAVRFLEDYEKTRETIRYTDVYSILLNIIDGQYGSYVKALPDGKRKSANLNMLLKKAEDYGKLSYKGLFHFVRYIEMLKKHDVDYGEANTLDENDDAVRIMTIHKSKGLEFPICFVAGMNKGYNLMDSSASVIPDTDLGLGIDFVDPVRRIKQPTGIKRAASKKKYVEILAEEERVLYVAMTRAKEKLIMTGVVYNLGPVIDSEAGLSRCTSYLSLLVYGMNKAGLSSVDLRIMSAEDLIDLKIRERVDHEACRAELYKMLDERSESEDKGQLGQRFDFVYPYADEGSRFEKVSVTELKRRSMHAAEVEDRELPDETVYVSDTDMRMFEGDDGITESSILTPHDETDEYIPDFIREQEKEIPATLHGTAVHRIFEIWDYDRGGSDAEVQSFMEYVREKGLMEDELVGCVRIPEVSGFLNSDLAARMKAAYKKGQLYREQPFMISHGDIIIQGIIDAYFIEDDKIVIVDYKTDRVADVNELKERYHVQLEYYAKALSTLLDKPVSQMLIYSTRHNETVAV